MTGDIDKTHYILPLDQPIVYLDADVAFCALTDKEKFYAYYLSKASWVGGLITLLQTSPESGQVFVLLHKLYSGDNIRELKERALNSGFSDDEVTALLVYSAGVFCNAGNYKVFFFSKFLNIVYRANSQRLGIILALYLDLILHFMCRAIQTTPPMLLHTQITFSMKKIRVHLKKSKILFLNFERCV